MSPTTGKRPAPALPERKKMSNVKFSLIIVAVFVVAVGGLFAMTRFGGDSADNPAEAASIATRDNSHRLSSPPGATVNFVEFLDFECEACGAVYPAIEQLREQYGDRVNFVVRYFPVPSHFNAERSARAVEAAAQQGKFEPMYKMMYDTQKEWGEQQVPLDGRFRGYAQQLGLDMARFDRVYNDPATLERVKADREDGLALGVEGTPTFFVNGQKLEPRSFDDLTKALDDALAAS
ncbi:protein-disulfide isomerase [Pseudonocardia sediminis]|uniref:Protein-disulfide isomerase n=1 Tax=Pseudonocardia sediminis TaxID=1397368 RepID=A0A4Q7UX44_PSEST|nr:thioredoxin domain-containing protein [Pseudonocardia sediminis]RZT85598.1 protein-disulfide isomerase [Pseudonocardia sediminis]